MSNVVKKNEAGGRSFGAVIAFVLTTVFIASNASGQDGSVQSYYGPAYIHIPGIEGAGKVLAYKGWVKTEGHYWRGPATRSSAGWLPPPKPAAGVNDGAAAYKSAGLAPATDNNGILGRFPSGLRFTTSMAPTKGDLLTIAVSKASPSYKPLMDRCISGAAISEVRFAENSELVRSSQEYGPRPADIPEYYEYTLKNVAIACPVAAGAPDQAFQLAFDAIEWRNFKSEGGRQRDITSIAVMPKLQPINDSGESKAFVISWYSSVADSSPDQCAAMNEKPGDAEYYALFSPERAAEQRKVLERSANISGRHLPFRGPGELNVLALPGIVAVPAFNTPKVDVVRGFNLDGDDGTGPAPPNTARHRNFIAPWGEKGVDNQLFVVTGCIDGFRRNGYRPNYSNNLRRSGLLSTMLQIDGIDNDRNDEEVYVTLFYSNTPMKRDGTSKIVLPNYTFSLSDETEYAMDFTRLKGKIVDGVITTQVLPHLSLHEGMVRSVPMYNARMRLEIKADGSIEGIVGGYRDWRRYMTEVAGRLSFETLFGYDVAGLYAMVKRSADGLKDPVTGEYNGISTAFELQGVPAFLSLEGQKRLTQR